VNETGLRKAGETHLTSRGGTSSAGGGWRRVAEEQPMEGAVHGSAGHWQKRQGAAADCVRLRRDFSAGHTGAPGGVVCVRSQVKMPS